MPIRRHDQRKNLPIAIASGYFAVVNPRLDAHVPISVRAIAAAISSGNKSGVHANAGEPNAAAGDIRGEYQLADITSDPLPQCDAILCRDCLVHLSFANIARAVANFQASGATWLIATTFPDWQANCDCEDGDWRALNFERAPFDWGPPVELLNENCDEAGGGWCDKSLGAWRLSDIKPTWPGLPLSGGP